MRHVPPLQELVARVGGTYRRRIELILEGRTEAPAEARQRIDALLHPVAQWLERIAESTRTGRLPGRVEGGDAAARVRTALESAAEGLGRLDPERFRRRAPEHQFAQSGAELIWEAVLAAGYALALACEELAAIDPDLWWNVYDTSSREFLKIEA